MSELDLKSNVTNNFSEDLESKIKSLKNNKIIYSRRSYVYVKESTGGYNVSIYNESALLTLARFFGSGAVGLIIGSLIALIPVYIIPALGSFIFFLSMVTMLVSVILLPPAALMDVSYLKDGRNILKIKTNNSNSSFLDKKYIKKNVKSLVKNDELSISNVVINDVTIEYSDTIKNRLEKLEKTMVKAANNTIDYDDEDEDEVEIVNIDEIDTGILDKLLKNDKININDHSVMVLKKMIDMMEIVEDFNDDELTDYMYILEELENTSDLLIDNNIVDDTMVVDTIDEILLIVEPVLNKMIDRFTEVNNKIALDNLADVKKNLGVES